MRPDRGGVASFLGVVFIGVTRRDRVNEIDDGVHSDVTKLVDFIPHFFEVVPAIRRASERDAIGDDALGGELQRRVRQLFKRAGAMQAAMVAQLRAAKSLDPLAYPHPGVFFVLADVFLDHDRDEKFHRLETDAVYLRRDRQHRGRFHAEGPKALLPIAQGSVDEMDGAHGTLSVFDDFFCVIGNGM